MNNLITKNQNKGFFKRKRRLVNNLWLWLMVFGLMTTITMVAVCFSTDKFDVIRDFWGFWLLWSLFLAIFIFGLVMFVINIVKIKKDHNCIKSNNLISDFKTYKRMIKNAKN